jgi:DNA mismatch repair protein MutL
VLGQAGSTYITAEGPDGLYLIDQHAAHERITYERLRSQFASRSVERQGMLAPELIELDLELVALLAEEQARLDAIGFNVEVFGETQVLVRAVPGLLAGRDPAAGLRDILRLAHSRLDTLAWVDRALTTVACHGSIRAGQILGPDEMRTLVGQLEASPNSRTCPHGRPTIVHLSATQLERQFGRR